MKLNTGSDQKDEWETLITKRNDYHNSVAFYLLGVFAVISSDFQNIVFLPTSVVTFRNAVMESFDMTLKYSHSTHAMIKTEREGYSTTT